MPFAKCPHMPGAITSKCNATGEAVVVPPASIACTCKEIEIELKTKIAPVFRVLEEEIIAGYLVNLSCVPTHIRPTGEFQNLLGELLQAAIWCREGHFRRS